MFEDERIRPLLSIAASGKRIRFVEELEIPWPEQEWILEAFYMLSSARQSSAQGRLPITMQDIAAYLEIFPVDDKRYFVKAILALDRELMDFQEKLRKSAQEQ